MKKQISLRTFAPGIGALAFFCMASGTAVAEERVATVNMTPSAVTWQPQGQYSQITLTISGPEGVSTRVFAEGVPPAFQAGNLPDGSYKYELTVTPVIADASRAQLMQARESGDMSAVSRMKRQGDLPSGPTRQSGFFRIMKGAIFTDQNKEEG